MKIAELKPDSNFDEIKVRILSKQGPREVNAKGRMMQVWDILVVDDTGTTTLTLWGATAADNYKVGQVITINDGWCKQFMDKKQISLGRGGKIFPADDDSSIPTKPPE
ncbi:MAG: hypothetical protein GOP50_03180 [Candidatus Heimdallarchaeota archaeon]|nr:hypothetical protein [Candidatus Heimdallarchaeota archaeon]